MHFVPYAPHGLDELVAELLLQLVPQVSDMDHDGIVGYIIFLLPHLLKDVFGAEDSSRLTGEQVQNVELPGGQGDRSAVRFDLMGRAVDIQAVDLQAVAVHLGEPRVVLGGAADQAFHARGQLQRIERLDHIVVGAGHQA